MNTFRQQIQQGLVNTAYFISEREKDKDPFGTSFIVLSQKTENEISLACYKGDYTMFHLQRREYPSVLDKKKNSKVSGLLEFDSVSDILTYIQEHMDDPI
jgi:hypothetical protein